MALRALTPDEQEKARRAGLTDLSAIMADENGELIEVSSSDPAQEQIQEPDLKGVALRQGAQAVIPAVGGRLAGAGAGAALGSSLGPIGTAVGGIGGAILGGAGTAALQDWVLRKIGSKVPAVAEFVEKSDIDRQTRPYTSTAIQMLTGSPFGGGGVNPLSALRRVATEDGIKETGKQVAQRLGMQGGLQGGIEGGRQLAMGEQIDPTLIAMAGIGGAALSRPSTTFRNLERRALSGKIPEGILNKIAPALQQGTALDSASLAERQSRTGNIPLSGRTAEFLPAHQRPDFNPEWLLSTETKNLKALGPFERAVAGLRDKGVELLPEDLVKLSTEGPARGFTAASQDLLRAKLPELDARAERLKAANQSNESQLRAIQQATQRQKAVNELTTSPESVVKSAEESAQAIQERPAQGKEVDATLQKISADAARLKRLKKIGEGFEGPEAIDYASLVNELEIDVNRRLAELPEQARAKLLYGEQGIAPAPEGPFPEPVKPAVRPTQSPAQEPTPVPEQPSTLDAQLELLRQGKKRAVLVTPGAKLPALQQGEVTTPTSKGIFIHRPEVVKSDSIYQAVKSNTIGDLLGYGVSQKPAMATEAVVLAKPSGTPVQEVAVTPETKPQVVAAAEQIASPGDVVETKTPSDVILSRITPGTRITIGDQSFEVSNVSGERVGWKGNARRATNKAELLKMLESGKAVVEGPSNLPQAVEQAGTPSRAELIEDTISLGNQISPVTRELRMILSAHPKYTEWAKQTGSMKPGNFFASLSSDEQDAVLAELSSGASKSKGMQIKTGTKRQGESGTVSPELLLKPLNWLRNETKSALRQIMESNPVGYHFGKKAQQMNVEKSQIENPLQDHVLAAEKYLKPGERQAVSDYLYEIQDTGASTKALNPELLKRAQMVQRAVQEIGVEKSGPNSPLVWDIENGKLIQRPFQVVPNYMPQAIKPEIWKTFKSGKDLNRITALREEYIKWAMTSGGIDRKVAEDMLNAKLFQSPVGSSDPNPAFAGVRKAQGIGIPPSWRANVFDAVKHHVNQTAADLAWHRNMESDPVIGKALNLKDNGRGEVFPETVVTEDGTAVDFPVLANNRAVEAVIRDYTGAFMPDAQAFESIDRFVKSLKIQTLSNVRDILTTPGVLGEIMNPSEYKFVLKGLNDAFDVKARQGAMRAGAIRPSRNITQTSALELSDGLNKLADQIHHFTGSELLNQMHRTFLYSVGNAIATKRIAAGDESFIKQWGPLGAESMNPKDLAEYIGTRISQSSAGSYNFEELPPAMLRGSGSVLKPLLSLTRWSIGRMNRWRDNVIAPAKQGNIKPLITSMLGGLASAGMVNWLNEQITGRKPRELTWEEYLNLGGKDTAYTLFSKAMTAGYAGILSDLAFSAAQMGKKEMPRGFNNLALSTIEDFATRASQWASGLGSGDTSFADLPTLALETMKDNVQMLKLLVGYSEDTGARDEMAARRTGFLPPGPTPEPRKLSNPFSESGRYRREDAEGLRRMMKAGMKRGEMPRIPGSDLMREPGYYQFLEAARGPQAVNERVNKDAEDLVKRFKTFSTAIGR